MRERESDQDELIEHLVSTTRLSRGEAQRLVAEVLAYFNESAIQFVTRRHAELKRQDLRNPEIFDRITQEVRGRRFIAGDLSPRQIRRIIYG